MLFLEVFFWGAPTFYPRQLGGHAPREVGEMSPWSEQLPCRSAEVKFFSVFLCQRRREIWREILVKFSVLRFPGFGCATENFTKISRQKRGEKRKISRKFHSAGAQR